MIILGLLLLSNLSHTGDTMSHCYVANTVCNSFLLCQDELSTLQLLKKQLSLEQTIEDYAETIGLLSQQCRQLLELGHPDRYVFI